jgi:hypothetical protein
MEERQKIINNITEITKDNIPIEIQSIRLDFSCNKYSSKKNSIYHITLNDKHVSKKDAFHIKYKCITCEANHIVGTTQFLRKINKCSYRCSLCVNKEDVKQIPILPLSLREQKTESDVLFDEYDDDFKDTYYSYHLTDEDYKRISKNIISLQNGKYKIEDLEYWAVFKTNNQMLFSSVFYDKANDLIIKANQPILRCENCGNDWRAKTLEKFKNCHKILCSSCTLCNKTFKIRTTKNCVNDSILYQSKLELNFINWCNNNSIIVKNGPTIPCIERKYKVDFRINDLLIEIKDNHYIKNDAKINAVKEAIEKGIYKKYYLITPDVWVNTLKTIKLQSNKSNKI